MEYSFVIITGMSGAGKSVAVRALEDIGYFCIDNMPTALILKLLELKDDFFKHNKNVACVVDIRNGGDFSQLLEVIKEMQKSGTAKIIFLNARDKILMDRYKETRRVHPLMLHKEMAIDEALKAERDILLPLFTQADYIVDTSLFSTSQLKDRILSYIVTDKKKVMSIDVVSFGYKFGNPADADLMFDVRCLKNPFYVKELKQLTGNDSAVSEFVFAQDEAKQLFEKQASLIDFSLPLYLKEGKSHLTIGYGCTGGKHRSVSFANAMYYHIKAQGYVVNVHHRDINRGK